MRWTLHLYQSYSTFCVFLLIKFHSALLLSQLWSETPPEGGSPVYSLTLIALCMWDYTQPLLCFPLVFALTTREQSLSIQQQDKRQEIYSALPHERERRSTEFPPSAWEAHSSSSCVLWVHSLTFCLSLIVASSRRRSRLDTLLQLSGVWHPFVVSQNGEGVSCTFNLTDSSQALVCTTGGHCVLEQRQGEGSRWEMTNQAKVGGQAPTGQLMLASRCLASSVTSCTRTRCRHALTFCTGVKGSSLSFLMKKQKMQYCVKNSS